MKLPIQILVSVILSLSFVNIGFTDDDRPIMNDHIMMIAGQVLMIKKGKSMSIDKEIVLSNGTKIAIDGTVTTKDGTKRMMKEGEMISMDGEIMKHDAKDRGN